ncbi:MAG: L-aspartate oxidase [Clostridiales bacterium]|nr:L-aspartate oxidase [Clostridiales bacterium]
MRRYIYSGSTAGLEQIEYDVLIVGSGIAGLYVGLHIDPSKRAAIVTKVDFEKSNSWLAQGGIAAVIDPSDHFESHVEDTLKAGAGLCDVTAVETLVKEGPDNISELVELNVPFDLNPEGELMITREGGHSCRRIVHCGGDATGRETTRRLGEIALERKNLDILFNTYLIDILTEDDKVTGAIVFDGKPKLIKCPNIVIATGGIGALYNHTTNPMGAVGDGIAAAQRAGAEVVNMELVQFHPTTMMPQKGQIERRFLISEAVRGEGGILRNHLGEAFMQGKHELADLAPRDIVTREIIHEMRRTGRDNVYLDVSSMSEEFFSRRFPTIFGECRKFGINVPEDSIPVRPAQHYLMGGINTDLNGMTNIVGLYACGECAWTGIHGGNRLASNSMLECLVFGRRAARHICSNMRNVSEITLSVSDKPLSGGKELAYDFVVKKRAELRDVMTNDANAVRTPAGMAHGKAFIDELLSQLDAAKLETRAEYELYSMATIADDILTGAINRKVSVGAHYIEA